MAKSVCLLCIALRTGLPHMLPSLLVASRLVSTSLRVCDLFVFFFQAEDGIRHWSVTGVQTCAFFFQAEDGIRDWSVTGVQTCALPIQAEDGIRDWSVTGVQTCALPISRLNSSH